MWIFAKEPIGKSYEELIDLATKVCNEFILVRGHLDYISKNSDNLLKELSKFLIEEKQQQSWPGTELEGGYALVYYFKLNDLTKEILKKYSDRLYSWMEPMLLSDLCFLKEERKPWIINIPHEQFCYLENSSNENINALKSIQGIELEEI